MEKTAESNTEFLSYSCDSFYNRKEDDEEEEDGTNRKKASRLLPNEVSNHR